MPDSLTHVPNLELLGHAKCACGEPMSEADKYNAGLCVRCWTIDASINHQSNIIHV